MNVHTNTVTLRLFRVGPHPIMVVEDVRGKESAVVSLTLSDNMTVAELERLVDDAKTKLNESFLIPKP